MASIPMSEMDTTAITWLCGCSNRYQVFNNSSNREVKDEMSKAHVANFQL
jgi:hypothetical protein